MTIRSILCRYRALILLRTINLSSNKYYSSKVPSTPAIPLGEVNEAKVNISNDTIALLERLSLVKFDTSEGVQVLEDSINFANKILNVDTEGVEPLYSVLEDEKLYLRSDTVTQGNCQKDVLKNATITEEDYFVAPPGNIPLHDIKPQAAQPNTKCKAKSTKSSN